MESGPGSQSERIPAASSVPPLGRLSRGSLLVLVGVAHLLVIAWLATRPPELPLQRKPVDTVLALSAPISAPPAGAERQSPKAKVTRKVKPVPVALPISPAVNTIDAAASAEASPGAMTSTAGAGGGCDMARQVGDAIARDASAMAELAALPDSERTEADAVMLWDGQWSKAVAPATGASSAIRRVIQEVVLAASAECRDASTLGPQFIAVPELDRTTTVVVGSGAWRWVDLLRPECSASGLEPCADPSAVEALTTRSANN